MTYRLDLPWFCLSSYEERRQQELNLIPRVIKDPASD